MPAGLPARRVAGAIYSSIIDERHSLDAALDSSSGLPDYLVLDVRDRRFVHALLATLLRRRGEIRHALGQLIEKPPGRRAGRLMPILEIAAAQILYMDVPDHAAVSLALEEIGADRDAKHFKGLANAVLRRLAREREAVLAGFDDPLVNLPDWLRESWIKAYGAETAQAIAEAQLFEPPLDLTVKHDAEGWAKRLGGIVLPTGSVRLVPSGRIEEMEGYGEGAWWVQDAAAALPARLLGDVAGKRIADLCAAPGGKTAMLAHAGAQVTAVDISAERLKRLSDNLTRLKLSAEVVAADILAWEPAEKFDAVLLDAPCSSTGTIRRHPDIASTKRPEDVASLAALQPRLIERAAGFLKPGGILVYCTCSLQPEEGEAQFAAALERHALRPLPVASGEVGGLSEAVAKDGTVRTLPSHLPHETRRLVGMDGFFIGRFQKS